MMLVEGSKPSLSVPAHTTAESPLGQLTLVKRAEDLVGLYFPNHRPRTERSTLGRGLDKGFDTERKQLAEYLAGTRREFDLSCTAMGTELEQRVWRLLGEIAYGETATYGELAKALGDGTTAREVGAAISRNPLSIVIPCHRVVGADGSLTGYAGGDGPQALAARLGSRRCRTSGPTVFDGRVAGHPGRLFLTAALADIRADCFDGRVGGHPGRLF